jgi:hypothetical protein
MWLGAWSRATLSAMNDGPNAAARLRYGLSRPPHSGSLSKRNRGATGLAFAGTGPLNGPCARMFVMWRKRGGAAADERRHQETLDLARRQLQVNESTAHTARWAGRLQALAVAIAVVGVLVSILLWAPWKTGDPLPKANITLVPNAHNSFAPTHVARLPLPPPYPAADTGEHCANWTAWLEAIGAASEWPYLVEVSAPARADVAVVSASVHVFRSYVPEGVTTIECVHGAGPIPGTLLTLHLANPNVPPTIVADDGSDTPLRLPDAVINVEPGHTEYIALTPDGAPRMYEWSVTLRVVVAQHTRSITFGSSSKPLRSWLGSRPATVYDHAPSGGSWKPAS